MGICPNIDSGIVHTHQSARAVVGDAYPVLVLRDVDDLGVVANQRPQLARERLTDHAHAADRLEHGRLHVEVLREQHPLPESRSEHLGQLHGL
jgi:hypothetical protein